MDRKRIEDFIEEAKEIFPNYDYSKVNYINSKTKVEIICPTHGSFLIKPNNLLNHHGCQLCGKEKIVKKERKSCETFIKEAKEIFPNYDYSKVNYINNKTKIKIICPVHGEFLKLPKELLKGSGCQLCRKKQPKEKIDKTKLFIEKAKKNFGDKYDYSLVNYVDRKTPIKIICPIHGVFEQKAGNHIDGKGCFKCGVEKRSLNRAKNKSSETMDRLKKMYDYDFSISKYTKAIEFIEFKCKKHGIQKMKPNDMLNGHGCPACGNEAKNEDRKLTIEEVKERSIAYHGDIWDFTNSKYGKNRSERIEVKCKNCGRINFKPIYRVIYGRCDYCSKSQGESWVLRLLEEHKVEYIPEYSFEDCKYINTLPFDFYLPKLNIVIEYQGEQHEKEIKFFNDKHRKEKDEIKRNYCKEHNIKEIEIWYWENVEEKLKIIWQTQQKQQKRN